MLGQFYHEPVFLCVNGAIKTQNGIQPPAPSEVGDIRQEVLSVDRKGLKWAPRCPHFKRSNMATLTCCYSSVRMETIKLLPSPLLFSSFHFFILLKKTKARHQGKYSQLGTSKPTLNLCVSSPTPSFIASSALECLLCKCSQKCRRTGLCWLEWGFYVHFRDECSLIFCSYR